MPQKNKWVGYTQRGYLEIKQSILNKVRTHVPEQTDFSESNIFVIIVSIFAGLVEQLNYYIDQLMRESFVPTARRYSSLVRHSRVFDYRIKAANPASVDVTITLYKDGEPYTLQTGEQEVIDLNTVFISSNNLNWFPKNTLTLNPGDTRGIITLSQYSHVTDNSTLTSVEPLHRITIPGSGYVHNSMVITINQELWAQVNTFGKSGPNDKHFIIDIDISGNAFIGFGDGVRGEIPPEGGLITFSYKSTKGILGNITSNSFADFSGLTPTSEADEIKVFNYYSAAGGTGYENSESLRNNLPLSLRTLERAVTKQDYADIAALHPGVRSAYCTYECGKYVNLYIAPITSSGGIASLSLLQDVKNHMDKYRMITTFINTYPCGISYIKVNMSITGNLMVASSLINTQIRALLLDEYSYDKSEINKSIRVSDIYALVDNHNLVDFLSIKNLELIPYAHPQNHNQPLVANYETLDLHEPLTIRVNLLGPNQAQIISGTQILGTTPLNTWFNHQGLFKIRINTGLYIIGNSWHITFIPKNKDLIISDNSLPMLTTENLSLTIKEKLI